MERDPVCVRPERDERGRLLKGSSGNPKGRPPVSRYAKLFAAAAELGAVVVLLPPTDATVADVVAPLPPEAA